MPLMVSFICFPVCICPALRHNISWSRFFTWWNDLHLPEGSTSTVACLVCQSFLLTFTVGHGSIKRSPRELPGCCTACWSPLCKSNPVSPCQPELVTIVSGLTPFSLPVGSGAKETYMSRWCSHVQIHTPWWKCSFLGDGGLQTTHHSC